MQNAQPRRVPPPYAITSVDSALHLIQLMRDSGPLRVADAAAELGVSPSTAHRLLAMLVYRDFAIQDEDRRYHPGPAIGQPPLVQGWVRQLRAIARPNLQVLVAEAGESANLMIRVGTQVRFLLTAEGPGSDRIGDRLGVVLPAIYTAGGRAMLAGVSDRTLVHLLGGDRNGAPTDQRAAAEARRISRELEHVRTLGYARNVDDTEIGVSAIGVAVRDARGKGVAAVALAARSSRMQRLQDEMVIRALMRCRDAVEAGLAEARVIAWADVGRAGGGA